MTKKERETIAKKLAESKDWKIVSIEQKERKKPAKKK